MSIVADLGDGFIDGIAAPVPQFLNCKLFCVSKNDGAISCLFYNFRDTSFDL